MHFEDSFLLSSRNLIIDLGGLSLIIIASEAHMRDITGLIIALRKCHMNLPKSKKSNIF